MFWDIDRSTTRRLTNTLAFTKIRTRVDVIKSEGDGKEINGD